MTHVKRIRGCPHNPEKVDVIISLKSHFITFSESFIPKLRELLTIPDDEPLIFGDIEVPHQMIYVKEIFDKYKINGWPLSFNT